MKFRTKMKILIALLFVGTLAGCGNRTMTVQERENLFEENDYTNWEQSEYHLRGMKLDYEYNVGLQLSLQHADHGTSAFTKKMKDTLGISVSDALYASTAFIGNISPVNIIGTFMGINSDSPSFGSDEYVAQLFYKNSMQVLASNYGLLSHKEHIRISDIQQLGQSPHHKVHLEAKSRLLARTQKLFDTMQSTHYSCQYTGYKPKTNSYSWATIMIQPMQQYSESIYCSNGNKGFTFLSKVLVLLDGNDSINFVETLSSVAPRNVTFDSLDQVMNKLFDNSWTTKLTTNKDAPGLDRRLVISSKNQEKDWIEEYPKGSIY
jgi:hypothetical protein